MKNTEIPLQGILTRKNGKKYQAVPDPSPEWNDACLACAFNHKSYDFCRLVRCDVTERADRRGVVFIRRRDLEADPDKGT